MPGTVDVKPRSKKSGARRKPSNSRTINPKDIPTKKEAPKAKPSPSVKQGTASPSEHGWQCGKCSHHNDQADLSCQNCQGKLPFIALFKADRRNIDLTRPTRLSWEVLDAKRVVINPGHELVENKGVLDVFPDEDTEYVLTAYNEVGSKSLRIQLVLPLPIIHNFSVADPKVVIDYPTILHWEVENGAELSLNMDIGDVSGRSFTDAYLKKPGTCTLTAKNKAGEVSASLELNMGLPEINSFSVDSKEISLGHPSILSWEVANADKIEILPEVGEIETDQHQIEVLPDRNTTYTLRISNAMGEVEESVNLILPPPDILSFRGNSELSTEGEPIELSWEVKNAYQVEISQGVGPVENVGKAMVRPEEAYTVYTLTAIGHSGVTKQEFGITRFPVPLKEGVFTLSTEEKGASFSQNHQSEAMADFSKMEKELQDSMREHERMLDLKRVTEMQLSHDLLNMKKGSARKEAMNLWKRFKSKFNQNDKP